MPYTIDLSHGRDPQEAGKALALCVKTRTDAKRYLTDVNDSAHYPAQALIELVAEAYALTDAEAKAIYREWAREVDA